MWTAAESVVVNREPRMASREPMDPRDDAVTDAAVQHAEKRDAQEGDDSTSLSGLG